MRIDAHQHFWKYNPIRDGWINDSMKNIQRDFMPEDLEPVLKNNHIDGCVLIQSDPSENENEFQLANANANEFIKGVVGWVDFTSKNIEEQLSFYSLEKKMKGFRPMLQAEVQRDFMLRADFKRGIRFLSHYNFTYDILVLPDQLKYIKEFVSLFPEQLFIVDHLGKPLIKSGQINEWRNDIAAIAQHENVYCKLSGMVTEADWNTWKSSDIVPYMDEIVEAFGIDRILFGSDWPVCLVASTYNDVLSLVENYFSSFSESEQQQVFGGNAIKFYNL